MPLPKKPASSDTGGGAGVVGATLVAAMIVAAGRRGIFLLARFPIQANDRVALPRESIPLPKMNLVSNRNTMRIDGSRAFSNKLPLLYN